jgi:hypothetical protein
VSKIEHHLSKNVNNKKCAPKLIFFNEKKFRKIRIIFDSQNFAILDNFYSSDRKTLKVLRGWVMVLNIKEGLVECATVCVKSEVILA